MYHVGNRGARRLDIFHASVDRLRFLSILAGCSAVYFVRVHAYTLMDNHFHLLLEDPRGCLSSFMLSLQSSYARYFNDSRGRRGDGALFGCRFWSERVTTPRYYDEVASYILLNPLRCDVPLAERAEDYPWSSAALHVSDLAPAAFYTRLLEREGGLDALLERLPRPTRAEYDTRRREQFTLLLTGDWIAPHAVRCGRTPEQMRQVLAERAGMAIPTPLEPGPAEPEAPRASESGRTDLPTRTRRRRGATTVARAWEAVPRVTEAFGGVDLEAAGELIRRECSALVPEGIASAAEAAIYLLWRFTSAAPARIAELVRTSEEAVGTAIDRVKGLRLQSLAWPPLLFRLEWALHFRLRCSPWRA